MFDIIPLRIIPTLFSSSIIYAMVGLSPTASQYGTFVVILCMFNTFTTLFAMILSINVKSISVSNLFASIFMLFCLLFGGVLINQSITKK
jgi:uncharacterized protein with PQ loop repeat